MSSGTLNPAILDRHLQQYVVGCCYGEVVICCYGEGSYLLLWRGGYLLCVVRKSVYVYCCVSALKHSPTAKKPAQKDSDEATGRH